LRLLLGTGALVRIKASHILKRVPDGLGERKIRLFIFLLVLGFWGMNLEPHICQVSAPPLEPTSSPFYFSYFSGRVL
jgi:hypothetical protein